MALNTIISSNHQHRYYFAKIAFFGSLQVVDIFINSTCEFQQLEMEVEVGRRSESGFDKFDGENRWDKFYSIQVFFVVLQILGQISSFAVMSSILCGTFPFQIGLVGVLTKRFSLMLSIQGFYIFLTLLTSGLRMVSTFLDFKGGRVNSEIIKLEISYELKKSDSGTNNE